ncbi:MAG: hypothetical protein M3P85_10985, partial [Actinomycetota bacterium]|nr:hypothetical protein [Actinomycetota bacterium]
MPTIASLTRSSPATARLVAPALAQHSTIRARMANACALVRRFTNRSRVTRSSSVSTSSALGRPVLS